MDHTISLDDIVSEASDLSAENQTRFVLLMSLRWLRRVLRRGGDTLPKERDICTTLADDVEMLLEASATGSISEADGQRLREAVLSHSEELSPDESSALFGLSQSACFASGEFIASREREHLERLIDLEWEFAEWLYDKRHDSPDLQLSVGSREQRDALEAELDVQNSTGELVVRDDYETRVANAEATRKLFSDIEEVVDELDRLSKPSISDLRQLITS